MKAIATVLGLGFVPVIPGTLGSAVGLGIFWLLSGDLICQIVGCLGVTVLALITSGPTAKLLGQEDPGPVIIDEVAGMMVALFLLPVTWQVYLGAFILFRLLDVLKPWPIRKFEKLPGSWGIVLDDLAAGLITNGILRLALFIWS